MNDETSKQDLLVEYFVKRITAGLPLTLSEWSELSPNNQEIWEDTWQEYRIKNLALEAHYIADTLKGGTLAVDTIFDILPPEMQDKILLERLAKDGIKQS